MTQFKGLKQKKITTTIVVLFMWLNLLAGAWGISAASAKEVVWDKSKLPEAVTKYENFLLLNSNDYQKISITRQVFENELKNDFQRAVEAAEKFRYENEGIAVAFESVFAEKELSAEDRKKVADNDAFSQLCFSVLPRVAFAYQTPGPTPGANPYYHQPEVLALYLKGLNYAYSRGVTENAWVLWSSSNNKALEKRFPRTAADLSTASLNLGGFIQSCFLMRRELEAANLISRTVATIRNLVVNHLSLYPAFFEYSGKLVATAYGREIDPADRYALNADGIRLFVDYFYPYFLMISDSSEQEKMFQLLQRVIAANVIRKPGNQDYIKPDGTGYHHAAAYVSGYSPYAFEASAQLAYLTSGFSIFTSVQLDDLKIALSRFRIMSQKYSICDALRGRFTTGKSDNASAAICKAMAYLGCKEGCNDREMLAACLEFFDPSYFYGPAYSGDFHSGTRGVPIRGLGIYRVMDSVLKSGAVPAQTPQGFFVQPYASAAFFRHNDWLVSIKGFSTYLWDYEGPLAKQENTFGQNLSYGIMQIFSAGNPVNPMDSGFDLFNGWDWYHVPGTTASHYPIEKRSAKGVMAQREKEGITDKNLHRNYNSRTFIGGATLGKLGVFVQDLEATPFTSPTDLTARKTYFCIDDFILALGSDIRGGTKQEPTHTSIFQTSLSSAETATRVADQRVSGLNLNNVFPPGSTVPLSDAVGNSFLLVKSSSPLVVTRAHQRSMDCKYKPTEGDYAQAWLDHGIKPQGERYEYLVFPSDRDGHMLENAAKNPSAIYRLISDRGVHAAFFPAHNITGYAFYELVDTPSAQEVKSVNIQSVIVTQRNGSQLEMAVAVPDLGWKVPNKDGDSVSTNRDTKDEYAHAEAKRHELEITLRGDWKLSGSNPNVDVLPHEKGQSRFRVFCKDGFTQQLSLKSN